MQGCVEILGSPGGRSLNAEKRMIRVHAAERADLLHVVAAAADDDARVKQRLERLEISKPLVTKLVKQRFGVEVEPDRLNVHHHTKLGGFGNRLPRLEVRMRHAV